MPQRMRVLREKERRQFAPVSRGVFFLPRFS
jgi:hypothetical protein